uniref:G_PROTEIN_RECEP_F1_2 domain-containing protein n=1 Tax=Panagrellus redivivus TaxID=6233 RepID=A0A7E4W3K2_PANRE
MSNLQNSNLTTSNANLNLSAITEAPFSEEDLIPKPLVADYIEMSYLIIVLIVGVPINLHVLFKLLKQKRKSATYSVKRCFLLLKINLNVSDTLILFVNAGGKLAWLISYEWRAGEAMCRLFKFSSISTLYLSSNIVVCIAVDRLKTVLTAKTLRRDHNVITTKIILCIAWTLALVCSIPQIFVFTTVNILEHTPAKTTWYQCTDIWAIEEHLVAMGARNATDVVTFETLHELSHLFIVFYGPLIVMAVAYFIIAVKLTQYSNGPLPSTHSRAVSRRTDSTVAGAGASNKKYSTLSTQPSMSALSEVSEFVPVPMDFATDMGYHQEASPVRRPNSLLTAIKDEFNYCFCVNSENNSHNFNPTHGGYRPTPRISVDGASFSSMPIPRKQTTTSVDRKRFFSVDAASKNRCKKKNNSNNTYNGRQFELSNSTRQPGWRRQLRSRVFRTTLLVVVAHVVCWTPYNFISLLRFVSEDWFLLMQAHINICEDMQFLIALVNPFLYGFGKSPSPY